MATRKENTITEKRMAGRKLFSKGVRYEGAFMERGTDSSQADFINISRGGACIETGTAAEVGNVLRLSLPFEDTDVVFPGFAEVRWSSEKRGKYMLGLQFLA